MSYTAAALGWQSGLVLSAADDVVAALLGLDRVVDFVSAERETPDILLWIGNSDGQPDPARLLEPLHNATWHGSANPLSQAHVHWPDIDSVVLATYKPSTRNGPGRPLPLPPPVAPASTSALPRLHDNAAAPWSRRCDTYLHRCLLQHARGLLARCNTLPWNALPSFPSCTLR